MVVGLLTLNGRKQKVKPMNLFRKIGARFTARGRALVLIDQGMACANKAQPDVAIKHYTDVINSSNSPSDVKAMALFNRALVYTTIAKEQQATVDLKAILTMPEAMAKVKKSANDKLVRMQRKRGREETAKSDS